MSRKRPDIFNQKKFEVSLRRQGCAESFVSPTVSDFKLFVPIIIKDLGPDKIMDIVKKNREDINLGDAEAAWKTVIKYMVGWAEEQIEFYKIQK